MQHITTVGIDLAKEGMAVGYDRGVVGRKVMKRDAVVVWAEPLPPCTVVMEACGSAHLSARLVHHLQLSSACRMSLRLAVVNGRTKRRSHTGLTGDV